MSKTSARHQALQEFLSARGYATIEELARHFEVTPQTVRKDINALAEEGKVQRFHGGAGMVSGHLDIGDRVQISGGTLVAKSIRKPGVYTAVYPLAEHKEWLTNAARVRQLDSLFSRVKELERELDELKNSEKCK